MQRINILNKPGMLTPEDRKQTFTHSCEHVTFYGKLDLSGEITVTKFGTVRELSYEQYSQDLAEFMVWWTNFVLIDLNGFHGLRNTKFKLVDFALTENN
jgi:hypothetical protein